MDLVPRRERAAVTLVNEVVTVAIIVLAMVAVPIEDAVPMDQLGPDTGLLSPLAVVSHLAQQQVGTEAAAAIGHGRPIAAGAAPEGVPVALVRDGKLLAIAERIDDLLRPRVVLENA